MSLFLFGLTDYCSNCFLFKVESRAWPPVFMGASNVVPLLALSLDHPNLPPTDNGPSRSDLPPKIQFDPQ